MSDQSALGFVLKRLKPGELKKSKIEEALKGGGLSDDVASVLALCDDKTGRIKAEAVERVTRLRSRYPALFAGVDISRFLPEVSDKPAPPQP